MPTLLTRITVVLRDAEAQEIRDESAKRQINTTTLIRERLGYDKLDRGPRKKIKPGSKPGQ